MRANAQQHKVKFIQIRPVKIGLDDYEHLVRIYNAVWPDNLTAVGEWQHLDRTRDPKYFYQRMLVELNGQVVGYAVYQEPSWSYKPGKYFIMAAVHPDHQGHGVGGALYNHMQAVLAPRQPRMLVSATRENKPRAIRFLEARGFKQVMRFPVSELEVDAFDSVPYQGLSQALASQGVHIHSVAQLKAMESQWKHQLHELINEVLQDVPSPDPITMESFEQFDQQRLNSPRFLPEGYFVAVEGGRMVGLSALWKNEVDPHKLHTGLTGVRRSHRRRGICTALKVRAIQYAKTYGAKVIETDNEENNPMFQINLQLGFKAQPAMLEFSKELDSQSA